jgi:hypothetical protein
MLLGSGLLAGALAACTIREETPVPASRSTSSTSAAPSPAQPGPSRVLMAYFSRPGENYYYGKRINLDIGNTEVVASMIAAAATVDVYRIEAADPYPRNYDDTVARNVREEDDDARPAIASPIPDVARYDTVLLGSPGLERADPGDHADVRRKRRSDGKSDPTVRHLCGQRHRTRRH